MREVLEETNNQIPPPALIGLTNDFLEESNLHYVTLYLHARVDERFKPMVAEPDKCEEWRWFSKDHLPSPLFITVEKFFQRPPPTEIWKFQDI